MKIMKKRIIVCLIIGLLISTLQPFAAAEDEDRVLHQYKFKDSDYGIYGTEETLELIKDEVDLMPIAGDDPTYPTDVMWEDSEQDSLDMILRKMVSIVNLLPNECRDINIYIYPGYLKTINGYYIKPQHKKDPASILIASHPDNMLDTFYHELGHHVEEVFYTKDKHRNDYSNLLEEKKHKNSELLSYSEKWRSSISESFAEDFKVYIKYSLEGKSLEHLKQDKKTKFEFNDQMLHVYDNIFPRIKNERFQNVRSLDQIGGSFDKLEYIIKLKNIGALSNNMSLIDNISQEEFLRMLKVVYKEFSPEHLNDFYKYHLFFKEKNIPKDKLLTKRDLVDVSNVFTSIHGRALTPNRANIENRIILEDLVYFLNSIINIFTKESF